MEIRFDDELTCRFALEVGWSTATHVSVVSQRSSECQTLLQNRQFISELRKGTKPVIWPWQEKIYICYFTSFQNFSMKSNCLTLGQKSPKSLIATAAILVVRTARGAGATSLLAACSCSHIWENIFLLINSFVINTVCYQDWPVLYVSVNFYQKKENPNIKKRYGRTKKGPVRELNPGPLAP